MGGDKSHVAIVLVKEYARKTSPSSVVRSKSMGLGKSEMEEVKCKLEV